MEKAKVSKHLTLPFKLRFSAVQGGFQNHGLDSETVESRQRAACWRISPVNSTAVTTDPTAVPLLAV